MQLTLSDWDGNGCFQGETDGHTFEVIHSSGEYSKHGLGKWQALIWNKDDLTAPEAHPTGSYEQVERKLVQVTGIDPHTCVGTIGENPIGN